MSAFDCSARLKTDKVVDTAAYLAFVRAQALDWTAEQKSSLRAQACELSQKLSVKKWALPAIADLKLIVTTGREEGNAAYTRAHAIVIPASMVTKDGTPPGLLAHELFHVLSRELLAQNPSPATRSMR